MVRSRRKARSILISTTLMMVFFVSAGGGEEESGPFTVLSETADTRTVRHAGGETVVPLRPERVATIGYLPIDTFVAMGRTPVATDELDDQLASLPGIRDAVASARSIGRLESPNLEALVSAEPDVILIHDKFLTPRNFRRLSEIAPTVGLTARTPAGLLSQTGRALGLDSEAEEAVGRYERDVAAARKRLARARETGTSVAFVRVRPRVIRLYGAGEGPGRVLYDELGLVPGPGVPADPEDLWANLSFEEIGRIEADHLFVGVDSDASDRERELRTHPLWSDLPAVEAGNVHTVRSLLWIAGDDAPIGSTVILGDVVQALGDAPATDEP